MKINTMTKRDHLEQGAEFAQADLCMMSGNGRKRQAPIIIMTAVPS